MLPLVVPSRIDTAATEDGVLSQQEPAIAILLDQSFDDWLSDLGISLDEFMNRMMGAWVFNYVQALQLVGAKPVLFCVSSRVESVTRMTHGPTGVKVLVFPHTKVFQNLRKLVPKLFVRTRSKRRHGTPVGIKERLRRGSAWLITSYLSTPVTAIFKALREEGCQAALIQEYESVRFDVCALAGRFMNVPVFGTFTGAFPHKTALRPLRWLSMRLASGLIICARNEIDRVRVKYSVLGNKVRMTQYPIDLSVWYPADKAQARASLGIPLTSRVVIYHGEILLWVKGLDILMEAWERISQNRQDRDLRLILVGTGVDAEDLARLIDSKRLVGVCWYHQWVHDRAIIQRYLSAADLYVFPSRSDAFGISIIEAMACGLPVIASHVRGIPDIFPQGEQSGGVLVPPGDAPALSEALNRILNDRELAEELGRRARVQAKNCFSMDIIGKELRSVLLSGYR